MKLRYATVMGLAALGMLVIPKLAYSEDAEGMTSGNWLVRPYLDLRVSYDNNVYRTERDRTDDVFADPEVGLLFSSGSMHNLFTLRGGVFYNRREYESESSLSHNSYGQNLELFVGSADRTRLQVVQGYRVIEASDRHAANVQIEGVNRSLVQDIDAINVERSVLDLGAGLTHRATDRIDLSLAYLFSALDYDEDAFIDIDGHVVQGQVAYAATPKTAGFLVGSYKRQEQEGNNQTADAMGARLGVRTRETDKLTLQASAGAERFERSLASGEDREYDNFSFSVSARWAATDKMSVRFVGNNGTQLSSLYRDNAVDYISASLGVSVRATDNVSLLMNGTFRRDEYVDRIQLAGGSFDRRDNRLQGTVRISYQPPLKFMQIYAQAMVEDVDSSVDRFDYTRFRATVGTTLAY